VHRVYAQLWRARLTRQFAKTSATQANLLLLVASKLLDRESIGTIAEASTNQDVAGPLAAYAQFLDLDGNESNDTLLDPLSSPQVDPVMGDELVVARRVVRLSQGIGAGGAYRAEALRQVVFASGSRSGSCGGSTWVDRACRIDNERVSTHCVKLERSAAALRELTFSAVRRVFQSENVRRADIGNVIPMSVLVERTLADGIPPNAHLVAKAVADLTFQLPIPSVTP